MAEVTRDAGATIDVVPASVDDARHAIAETRDRISATLDAIEFKIERKKDELKDKADVLRPVRSRIRSSPWQALGIAAGAGLVLGLLTGGEDEEEQPRGRRGARHLTGYTLDADDREALREWRAERRERMREHAEEEDAERTERRESASRSFVDQVKREFLSALTGAVGSGVRDRMKRSATS